MISQNGKYAVVRTSRYEIIFSGSTRHTYSSLQPISLMLQCNHSLFHSSPPPSLQVNEKGSEYPLQEKARLEKLVQVCPRKCLQGKNAKNPLATLVPMDLALAVPNRNVKRPHAMAK